MSYPYPEERVKSYPPSGYVYCPRHKRWEPIVEDDGLCDWCCVPGDWCLLHAEEDDLPIPSDETGDGVSWGTSGPDGSGDMELQPSSPQPDRRARLRQGRSREEDELDREAVIIDMTEA